MLELIILVATVVLLVIVLNKLPLEKEVVKKLAYDAKKIEQGEDGEEASETDTDALQRADHYAQDGQYKRAEKLYIKLISEDPQEASLYNKLALVYLGNKEFEDAARALDQALQLEPDNDTFYNNLGLLFYQQGDFEESVENYERSIDINNKVASRFMNLGLAYFMLKKYRKAADAYEKALILEPQNDEYKRLLSEAEAKLK